MFKRLLLDDYTALATIAAFITAVSIYVAFAWRALRMQRAQVARFENMPFATPTPAAVDSVAFSPTQVSAGKDLPPSRSGSRC